MIVIVFLLILLSILIYSASAGMAVSLPIGEILMLIGLFLAFFGAGVYIAVVLGALALIAGFAFSGRPFWLFMGQVIWAPSSSFVLVAVPLFLLMGEILLRTGLSEQLYKALNVWLRRWPGGLLHTNIASCAVFSAISGSSVATAATMGSVALPYFDKTPYNQRMVLGSLAAGGALGNLIPPGITFILYGLMTETSVGKLYIAAVVPSIIVCSLFFLVILVHGLRQRSTETPPRATAQEKLKSFADLVPTTLLILIVLGTIYGGLATPTEAAALGVVAACAFALDLRQAYVQAAARLRRGHSPQHRHAGADPVRRLHAELHHGAAARAADACRHGGRAAATRLGHHARHHRLLLGARDVHGGLRHDHHDDPGGVPSRDGARLRPDLVRRDRHDADRDRHDQPTRWHHHVCAAGHAAHTRPDHGRIRGRNAIRRGLPPGGPDSFDVSANGAVHRAALKSLWRTRDAICN